MRGTGQLPVYRGQADAALVLRDVEQGLSAGACVIFYPEATATRDPDLWPMAAKTGVARAALATGVPVIPVAQWGRAEDPALREHAPAPAAPHHGADHRGPAGRPVRVSGPAADLAGPPRGHRSDHERHHRAAGRHPRRDPAGRAVPSGDRPPQGPAGGARTRQPGRSRKRPPTRAPRPPRREGRGHGGRVVGNHVRPGALRRGHARRAVGPPGRAGQGDQRHPREPRVPARHRAARRAERDRRSGRGPGRRGPGGAGRAGPVAAREPRRLGSAAAARRAAGQPDQGDRDRHLLPDERGHRPGDQGARGADRRGHRPQPGPRDRAARVRGHRGRLHRRRRRAAAAAGLPRRLLPARTPTRT